MDTLIKNIGGTETRTNITYERKPLKDKKKKAKDEWAWADVV
jgi:hypothetical protein